MLPAGRLQTCTHLATRLHPPSPHLLKTSLHLPLPRRSLSYRYQVVLGPASVWGRCEVRYLSNTHVNHQKTKEKPSEGRVMEAPSKQYEQLTPAEKAKENVTTSFYGLVILIGGVGIIGIIIWTLGPELFSGQSPQGVYSRATKDCLANTEILNTLGEPVKAYGELTSRGRRRHTAHVEYEHDGFKYIRMKFYLEGPRRKGTVHLEKRKELTWGKRYDYRYLFLELDGHPPRTIVLHDNRYDMSFNT